MGIKLMEKLPAYFTEENLIQENSDGENVFDFIVSKMQVGLRSEISEFIEAQKVFSSLLKRLSEENRVVVLARQSKTNTNRSVFEELLNIFELFYNIWHSSPFEKPDFLPQKLSAENIQRLLRFDVNDANTITQMPSDLMASAHMLKSKKTRSYTALYRKWLDFVALNKVALLGRALVASNWLSVNFLMENFTFTNEQLLNIDGKSAFLLAVQNENPILANLKPTPGGHYFASIVYLINFLVRITSAFEVDDLRDKLWEIDDEGKNYFYYLIERIFNRFKVNKNVFKIKNLELLLELLQNNEATNLSTIVADETGQSIAQLYLLVLSETSFGCGFGFEKIIYSLLLFLPSELLSLTDDDDNTALHNWVGIDRRDTDCNELFFSSMNYADFCIANNDKQTALMLAIEKKIKHLLCSY